MMMTLKTTTSIRSFVIGSIIVVCFVVAFVSFHEKEDGTTTTTRSRVLRRSNKESVIETTTTTATSVVSMADGKMFQVLEELHHDSTHFTQGLTYSNGRLYESVGLYERSEVCELDSKTGDTLKCVDVDPKYFAEGMQVYGDNKLIQLTWKSRTGFIRDANTLEVLSEFQFETTKNEGWGICYNPHSHEFIVSDGSAILHFWDADTLQQTATIKVTRQNGKNAVDLNELEFVNGKVLANVWHQDVLLVINPETGKCEKEYDFSMLFPRSERRIHHADVLNGISVSDEQDVLYITGKFWDRMYKVKLLDEKPDTEQGLDNTSVSTEESSSNTTNAATTHEIDNTLQTNSTEEINTNGTSTIIEIHTTSHTNSTEEGNTNGTSTINEIDNASQSNSTEEGNTNGTSTIIEIDNASQTNSTKEGNTNGTSTINEIDNASQTNSTKEGNTNGTSTINESDTTLQTNSTEEINTNGTSTINESDTTLNSIEEGLYVSSNETEMIELENLEHEDEIFSSIEELLGEDELSVSPNGTENTGLENVEHEDETFSSLEELMESLDNTPPTVMNNTVTLNMTESIEEEYDLSENVTSSNQNGTRF